MFCHVSEISHSSKLLVDVLIFVQDGYACVFSHCFLQNFWSSLQSAWYSDLSANSPQNDAVCSKMKHINQSKHFGFSSMLSDEVTIFLKKEEIIVEGFPL